MRVVGERLFDRTGRGDRETSERIQRDCSDEGDDPPCEENQRQGHYDASPLLVFRLIQVHQTGGVRLTESMTRPSPPMYTTARSTSAL